jgi:hypothetical protein
VAASFVCALVTGAALLALWIDVRFPGLAPKTVSRRMLGAVCAVGAFSAAPVFHGSIAALYATFFALLVSAFLTAVWLLRAVRDAQLTN